MIKRGLLVFILAFSLGLSSAIIFKPKPSCAIIAGCVQALISTDFIQELKKPAINLAIDNIIEKAKEYVNKKIEEAKNINLKVKFNLSAVKATFKNYHLPKMEGLLGDIATRIQGVRDRKQEVTKRVQEAQFDALECGTASATKTSPASIKSQRTVAEFSRNKTSRCVNRASEDCSSPAREIKAETDFLMMTNATNTPAQQNDIEGGAFSDFACPAAPQGYQNAINKYLYGGLLLVDSIEKNPYTGDTLGGSDSPSICQAPLEASHFSDLWEKQAKYVISGAVGRATFPGNSFNTSNGREAFVRSKSYDIQLQQLFSFKDWYFSKITPTMNNGQRLRAILRSNTGLPEPAQEALNSMDLNQPCTAMTNDSGFSSYHLTPTNVLEYLRIKDPDYTDTDPPNVQDAVGKTTVVGCDGQDYDISSTRRSLIEHIQTTYNQDQFSEKQFMDIMMSKRFEGADWIAQMNAANPSAIKRNTNNLMAFRLMQQRETHELLEYATLFAAIKVARRMGGSSRGQIAGMIQDLLPEGHKYANKEDILKATEVVSAANDNGDSPDDYIERLYQSMQ